MWGLQVSQLEDVSTGEQALTHDCWEVVQTRDRGPEALFPFLIPYYLWQVEELALGS